MGKIISSALMPSHVTKACLNYQRYKALVMPHLHLLVSELNIIIGLGLTSV